MAVGTDRPQVFLRIDYVVPVDLRQWTKMVNVYVAFRYKALSFAEAEPTHRADFSVKFQALGTCRWIPLVGVNRNTFNRSLHQSVSIDLFG
jgi:hypothetical protein